MIFLVSPNQQPSPNSRSFMECMLARYNGKAQNRPLHVCAVHVTYNYCLLCNVGYCTFWPDLIQTKEIFQCWWLVGPYWYINLCYSRVYAPMSMKWLFLCCSHQDPEQLFQACEQGDLEVVDRFLAANIDVDITDTVSLEFVLLCVELGVVIDTNIFTIKVSMS